MQCGGRRSEVLTGTAGFKITGGWAMGQLWGSSMGNYQENIFELWLGRHNLFNASENDTVGQVGRQGQKSLIDSFVQLGWKGGEFVMETCNLYSKGSGSLAVTAAKTDYENSTAAALLVAIYSSPLPGCQRDYLAELCTQKVHRACACVTSEAQDGALPYVIG